MKKELIILLVIIGAFALLQSINFVTSPRIGSSPLLIQTNDQNFVNNITRSGDWVLVEFWMPGCPACKLLKPNINQLAENTVGQLNIFTINLNESPAISGQFQIYATPTLVLLYKGREVDRKMGFFSEEELQVWISSFLDSTSPVPS